MIPKKLRYLLPYLNNLNDIVAKAGIYFLCKNDTILYIGMSQNLLFEIASVIRKKEFKDVNSVFYIILPFGNDDRDELKYIEEAFISFYKPVRNKNISKFHKDVTQDELFNMVKYSQKEESEFNRKEEDRKLVTAYFTLKELFHVNELSTA